MLADVAYAIHGSAFNADYDERTPTATRLMVKRQGRTTLTGARSSGRAKLRMVARRYDGGYPLWKVNTGATALLQRKTATGWATLSTRTVPSTGVLNWSLARPHTTYRIAVREAATAWSSTSASLTR